MPNSETLKEFNEKCRKGKHPLKSIYSDGFDMESKEVRWCPVCGSIVIDLDYDGRTKSGAVMAMRRPRILVNLDGRK